MAAASWKLFSAYTALRAKYPVASVRYSARAEYSTSSRWSDCKIMYSESAATKALRARR